MSAIIIFFSLFLKVLYDVIQQFLPIILLMTFLLALFIIIKVRYRVRKYGKKEYQFKTVDNSKHYKQDIVHNYLNKIPGSKLLLPKLLNANYLLITKASIYLIYYYEESGYIHGNITKPFLKHKINNQKDVEVINPYHLLNEDEKKLIKLLDKINIRKIIIINNNCLLVNNTDHNFHIFKFQNFFDGFKKIIKEDKNRFEEQEIDEYVSKLISL